MPHQDPAPRTPALQPAGSCFTEILLTLLETCDLGLEIRDDEQMGPGKAGSRLEEQSPEDLRGQKMGIPEGSPESGAQELP